MTPRRSEHEFIVFLMGADPDPSHLVAFQVADRSVVGSNSHGVQSPMQPLEPDGGMLGIRQPDAIATLSESLHFPRQSPIPLPKLRRGS
jgi:hypothetical protein